MTARPLDDAFERALRAALQDLAPDAAPSTLRAAVAAVPRRVPRGVAVRARPLFAVAGIAAALVIAVAGFGFVAGLRLPDGGLSPVGSPPSASPSASEVSFTVRVAPSDGSTPSKAQSIAVGDVLEARLRAFGVGTFSSFASDDRITFLVPGPLDEGSRDAIARLLAVRGTFSIGQPVETAPRLGDPMAGEPLVTLDSVTDARVGTDQSGNPTLDLTISEPAAGDLADATRVHVGQYLPIALDETVIAAPAIQSEIAGGRLQVSFASDDGTTANSVAAIIQSGPLPLRVELVAP